MFIIIEITAIGVGTIIAVCIMYLNSLAAFDYEPPKWLCKTLMLDCCQSCVKDRSNKEADEKIVNIVTDLASTQPDALTAMKNVGFSSDFLANYS
jgi:hypothetical protein